MVDLLESIFQTQKPTWVDCKQLLYTFFNTEELMRIVTGSEGVRAGAKKPTNMAKTSEVFQKPGESPAAFYERLCEAYRVYTPFNPGAPEYQTMVNSAFVGQAQPDIRRKLQKLEGFAGKNASELLEVANKLFINRDRAAKKEAEERLKQKATLIAAAVKESSSQTDKKGKQEPRPGGRRTNLKGDQCAHCKDFGHWKNECPKLQKGRPRSSNPPSRYRPELPEANLIGLTAADSD
ncbi:hypothetical protein QTO34_010598 [Cnephaeus nilssonii]|uniref:Core shell protein Gag P30 domain-containing protein n=1 Tax=Cnephaeus nilssonii TaxID=3371016 RepID=A0AA40HFV4_CNENI|nr:hypothetical protein QTO34_010598 [Eptesicus nilssonii]